MDFSSVVDTFLEFGPGWLLVGVLLYFAYQFGTRAMDIFERNSQERAARDKEMLTISAQMVDQMDRSNQVIESVEEQMATMNDTNAALVNRLLESSSRSQAMANDTAVIRDRVDFIYERTIKGA